MIKDNSEFKKFRVVENFEDKIMHEFMLEAKLVYERYPTSLEEDLKALEREDLTFNHRNCLLYTSGEKVILNFLINTCQKLLPLFDMYF